MPIVQTMPIMPIMPIKDKAVSSCLPCAQQVPERNQAPQGAFYAFPNITQTGMSSIELADKILNETGVACLPGPAFGEFGEGFLRFSYATSIETINEAIETMQPFFESL